MQHFTSIKGKQFEKHKQHLPGRCFLQPGYLGSLVFPCCELLLSRSHILLLKSIQFSTTPCTKHILNACFEYTNEAHPSHVTIFPNLFENLRQVANSNTNIVTH